MYKVIHKVYANSSLPESTQIVIHDEINIQWIQLICVTCLLENFMQVIVL